ncbi:uncharacterized protein LOC116934832 [Daphnia magna]|nr:uncharacterized protein LOC116934832 [Daphnia magna]
MKVSYDQLHTILVEIEAIVNSRPLTYVSGDAQAYEVLSPQRLLTGRQPGATTETSELTTMSRNELIDLDKQRSEHALTWWRLWQESYLSDLKDSIVAREREPNIKRVSWPTAIITELIPGYDGKIRAVKLRLRSEKETTRGLQTIYPLEIQHDVDPPVNVSVDGSRGAEAGQEEGGASAPKKKPPRKKKKESPRRTRDSGIISKSNYCHKSNLLKTNAAKVNATKTNAVNTVAEKPVTAKASANKSRHLNNLAKTVFSKIFNTQKDGVETISRFKQPLGIKPLSPLRDMNHQLPAPMSSSVSSHQHVAASPGSKRRLYVDSNTSSSLKKPAIAQESSFDKNVSRLTLKKSCEILECVNRVEQKIDRLLAFQDNQHIEDLFDEVMKLPVDDLDSWQMLEDLLMDKRNCIKLVSKYSTLGGSDLGDFVRRIWAALVTDKFGCELSWIGRDKKKIAVKGSNCFSLVVRTVKANIKYADVNDPDIEKASQDWIFKSKRRVQRAEDTSNVVESCVPSLSDSPVAGTSGCNRSTVSNI